MKIIEIEQKLMKNENLRENPKIGAVTGVLENLALYLKNVNKVLKL